MKTPSGPGAAGLGLILLLLAAVSPACERDGSRSDRASVAAVEREVTALLKRWTDAFEARDPDAVRAVLTTDQRFVWLEDGVTRYRSADDILKALAGLPPGMRFTHALRDVHVVPLSEESAWVRLATTTRIEHSGRVVSEFTSAVLMILRREHTAWRIQGAHSSTSKPRSAGPG